MTEIVPDIDNQTTKVVFDDTKTSVEEMEAALREGGYPPTGFTYEDDSGTTDPVGTDPVGTDPATTDTEPEVEHTDLTPTEAKDMIDTHPDLIIIDVREDYEFCGEYGHIPGSVNYPWNSGVLQEKYSELPKDADILIVCRSGNRSNQAASFLDSKGFTSVYDIGGMNSWEWDVLNCSDVPPTLSSVVNAGGSVSLNWTQYTGSYFESYTLLRSTFPDPEYPNDEYLRQETNAMVTSYDDEFPLTGTSYYRICVVKTNGEKLYSDSVRADVADSQPPVEDGTYHSADYNPPDYKIGLSELLRGIQLYNSGSYHCGDSGLEDGYGLETRNRNLRSCAHHDSDYTPQDWRISLTELLRLIQLYNSDGYHPDPYGEDGFSVGK
ncbi:rhodanese-like domain-containing protein [Desulfobacterales bacterium HSG2]|nr:rhodanese-like domain-containing protein [Desulfobacterales bacterium HSG2]